MACNSSGIEVEAEVVVFVDTSLGTHIAISVSPHLTVAQFKGKFGCMHSNCYPEIGNIEVIGLMVKRKSYLYHLPESMPIKHAFQGSKKAWFLYMKVKHLNKTNSSTPQSEAVHGCLSENLTKVNASSFVEPTSERMCKSISVSGIIKKYFSVPDDEVTSNNSKFRVLNYAPKTPPTMTNIGASRDQKKSSGVGKRVIVAANNLGVSTSDKKPAISLCKYKCKKISELKSSSATRHPVFELGGK